MKKTILSAVFIAAVIIIVAFLGRDGTRESERVHTVLPEAPQPQIVHAQPEVPEGYVQETTNTTDVTEAALNALGFSLTNSVSVSVK